MLFILNSFEFGKTLKICELKTNINKNIFGRNLTSHTKMTIII